MSANRPQAAIRDGRMGWFAADVQSAVGRIVMAELVRGRLADRFKATPSVREALG